MIDKMMVRLMSAAALAASALTVRADDWSPLWSTANLSQPRGLLAATSLGNEVYFGGGFTGSAASSVVDIYNISTGVWTTASLSQARYNLAATSVGGNVLFGGGNYGTTDSSAVDIYNSSTATWSTATLSQARTFIAATSAGSEAIFAGGNTASSLLDIYNTSTGVWSTANLSVGRAYFAATSVGDTAFFAGGSTNGGNLPYTSLVNIYDTSDGSWSMTDLPQATSSMAAVSCGNEAFFAGGNVATTQISPQTSLVQIYDASAGTWSTANLSQARVNLMAASVGSKVLFAGGYYWNGAANYSSVVDIYDTSTGSWTTANLSQAREDGAVAAVGNKVFFAGGYTASGVSSVVDIYTLQDYPFITSSKSFTLVDNTTVAGLMQLDGGSLGLANHTLAVGSMGGSAPINLGSGMLRTGSDGTSTSYSGGLSGGGSLNKIGSGVLALSGSNPYTGPTTVSQGKLVVDGWLTNSAVSVNGGTLGGTGYLGSVTVNSGGQLAPGDPQGTLHLSGNLTLLVGADMGYELDGFATDDEVSVSGNLILSNQQFSNFNFTPLAGFGPGTYDLIAFGSSSGSLGSNSGTVDGLPATLAVSGNELVLNVVPEPSTLVLLIVGAIGGLGCRWRRRRNTGQTG